jgi:hypothetical protein
MSILLHSLRRHTRPALAAGAGLILLTAPAAAQRGHDGRDTGDSLAWIVPRQSRISADAALRTQDRRVVLLLRDSALVLQLTNRGMDEMLEDGDSASHGVGGRILASMIRAGVSGILDHGVAYRVSALRRARAEGSRLVLEDREGKPVFAGVEINGRHPMDDFPPEDARRFADAVNRAIQARR